MTFAEQLIVELRARKCRIVLAESCTCGMAAAMLGGVAGASHAMCGSFVTYREASKSIWLGVDTALINDFTAESLQVSIALAAAALERTPEADIAAAITGHLGPNAPAEKDGRVMMAMEIRSPQTQLTMEAKLSTHARSGRQLEAADELIRWVLDELVERHSDKQSMQP